MEGVLRGKEMDKIEEIYRKAYDLSSNVVYFPIRHHSPACSFHLKNVIDTYKPEIVLIEGPSDANSVMPYIGHEETEAPICIYYSYTDENKLVTEEGEKYKCYYPFLDYSPELVAIRESKKKYIPAQFIDLPYAEILINSEKGKGLRKVEDKNSYNDDYLFEKSKFINSLCKKQGCRSFNELWEMLFEIDGLKIDTETFMKNMLTFCYLSRCFESEETLREEGCISREKYMAFKIKEMCSKYNKILVVTGGFHTSSLIQLSNENIEVELHNIKKKNIGAYAMVYSFEESDQLNGYASGMPYPSFYQRIWSNLCEKIENPYEKAVLDFIVRCGRNIRKTSGGISTADEIEALNMAKGLQSIRSKSECGVYELLDAVKAAFIKGELNMASDAPLMELMKLLRGKGMGRLCSNAEVPPIVLDFRELCRKYNIKIKNTLQQEIVLDLYKKDKHREVSQFLHRMKFLNTGFCLNTKGPDFINKRNVNLVRETWNYKWSVSVESNLIENSVHGGTIKEAVEALLLNKLSGSTSCGAMSEGIIEAFMMGYKNILLNSMSNIKEVVINDNNFYSVAQCTYNIYFLHNGNMLFSSSKNENSNRLLVQCYNKAVTLIPELYSVPQEEENKVIEKLKSLYHICLEEEFEEHIDIFIEALKSITNKTSSNAAVEGAALGLLLGLNEINLSYILKKAEGYLYGTGDKFLSSASFLKGVFSTAPDVVLSEEKILTGIDNVLKNMDEEDFFKLLPELRLSFSFFNPSEIDKIGKKISEKYGISNKKLFHLQAVDSEELKLAIELDKFGKETLRELGLLNE